MIDGCWPDWYLIASAMTTRFIYFLSGSWARAKSC